MIWSPAVMAKSLANEPNAGQPVNAPVHVCAVSAVKISSSMAVRLDTIELVVLKVLRPSENEMPPVSGTAKAGADVNTAAAARPARRRLARDSILFSFETIGFVSCRDTSVLHT